MADLDCNECSDEDKQWRGCGRAPRFPVIEVDEHTFESRQVERVWTPTWWFQWCEESEHEPSDISACDQWEWGGLGGAVELTHTPWDCCPRSYLRQDMMDRDAMEAAQYAIQLYQWREKGSLTALEPGPLTPGMIDLVRLAERSYGRQDRLRVEAAKAKHNAGDGHD